MTTKNSKFQPGKSGNPKGRPAGIPDRRSALRAALEKDLVPIVQRVVEAAKGGDLGAAQLVLSRCLPALRPSRETIELPAMSEAVGLTRKARAILGAVSEGRLSSDQASELLSSLGIFARLVETEDLIARIETLERTAHHESD